MQSVIQHVFESVDTSKSGEINKEQFEAWYEIRKTENDTAEVKLLAFWGKIITLNIGYIKVVHDHRSSH